MVQVQRLERMATGVTERGTPWRDRVLARVQKMLMCSVGGKPHRGKIQSLVAWIAGRKGTESLKPIDKAILGMVSESSGRNLREPECSLENGRPGGRAAAGLCQEILLHPETHCSMRRRDLTSGGK